MSRTRTLAFVALGLSAASAAHSQVKAADPSIAALTRNLSSWMSQGAVPGLSVAVVRNGKTAWIGNFGVADTKTGQRVDDHTLFGAASLSKTVFAYAVLKLVDQGKLDLDAPLTRYVPVPIIKDPRLEKITARIVLSHRTGFPNWRRDGSDLQILFEPGERFSYSGEGMVYLQKAIEAIEGKALNDVMQALVFTPLGMTQSSYVWQPAWAEHAATGYNSVGVGSPLPRSDHSNAAASLITTARDYALFLEAVLNGRGLKPATLRAMETPQVAVDPTCTNCTDHAPKARSTQLFWGLGWGIEQSASGKYLWHWGDNGIFKAYVVADVQRRSAVVMFDNSDTGLSIASAVTQAVLGGEHPSFAWLHYETYDSPNMRFARDVATQGVQHALTAFAADITRGTVSEGVVNATGYQLLGQKQYADVLLVFRRNVEVHPTSSNAHDSLGEAYMTSGDTTLAIKSYERALELDPGSENARAMLAKLRSSGPLH